ncbi:MAG: DUF2066 domain-containing protein [Wenzhouxiangellaceae bacterium]
MTGGSLERTAYIVPEGRARAHGIEWACAIVHGVIKAARILCFFMLASLCQAVALAEAPLYVGEAVVEPGAEAARAPLVEALNQVLVRLTGRAGQNLVAELGLDHGRAEALALSRQFRSVPGFDDQGRRVEQRRLRVDFDPRSVNALLARQGYPRWGSERPGFLLWITMDGPRGAEYLQQHQAIEQATEEAIEQAIEQAVEQAVEQASFRYGISVTRPMLDASDRIEVSPADIRGGFTNSSLAAMNRYGTDGVILLDLRQNQGFWTGRWAWRIGDAEATFQRSGARPAEVIDLGLGRIAGALAARFAVLSDQPAVQRLIVSGIDRASHYTEVLSFLKQLTGIDSVRVDGAMGDTLRFEISASADGLRRRIELTGPLRFERYDLADGTLYYQFAW